MQAIIWGLFICLTIIQAGYWLLFALVRTKSPSPKKSELPGISVIICAHDQEQNIRELVPLLLSQDHPNFEIIVVEDRCNDGTFDYLLAETAKQSKLKMVQVRSKPDYLPGKKYALTLGIKAAVHDLVLLTEPDCRPGSNSWVTSIAQSFDTQTEIVIGVAPFLSSKSFPNIFLRFENTLSSISYCTWAKIGLPFMGLGRNLAYRKQLFLENKGFNKHLASLTGDDKLFVNQHASSFNTNVAEDPRSIMYSHALNDLNDFITQKKAAIASARQFRFKHQLILIPFYLSYALWLPAITLTLFFIFSWWVISVVCLRWLLMILTISRFKKTYQISYPLAWIPVQDVLYSTMCLALLPAGLFTSKLVWKI